MTKLFRLGIVGLVHGHVNRFLNEAMAMDSVGIVGLADPSESLYQKYAQPFGQHSPKHYVDAHALLAEAKPDAVAVFTTTADHLQVVEQCAQQGVHVMMEKPLALNLEQAHKIEALAKKTGIHVLTNYVTTWFPSNHKVFSIVHDEQSIGSLVKIVVRAGHQGPAKLNCPDEFLCWLNDPSLNGGGALYDFGCYGANLVTWLMKNQKPMSITAITQQFQPKLYPNVDDEATLILTYPKVQAIIQASWNWPIDRKDMDAYCERGYVTADDQTTGRFRLNGESESHYSFSSLEPPNDHPITNFRAVVQNDVPPLELSSLENNLIVTEILQAARTSSQTKKTVYLT